MGCNESKEQGSKFENHSTENKQIDATNNNGIYQGKVKLNEANLKTSIDSTSPIDLQDEDNVHHLEYSSAVKTVKHSPPKQQRQGNDAGVSNAWAPAVKITKRSDQVNLINDLDNEDESEFGREGIDTHSSSFDGIRKKSSGRNKPMPTGIQSDDGQISTPNDVPRLTKKVSEEPFDPTPLIDVNKFKAANVATNEVKKENNNDTVTTETTTIEAQHAGHKTVLSPSNYHDFYDEDEKELMASIEQDFHATALPGVVT